MELVMVCSALSVLDVLEFNLRLPLMCYLCVEPLKLNVILQMQHINNNYHNSCESK